MLRVLVVEDEPAIRDTVSTALRRAGHQAVAVSSAKARGEALQTGRFDAIVTDALIPARNCLELLEVLQAGRSRVPVLAISGGGYGAAGTLPIVKLLGAQATLSKPFVPSELVAAVEAIVERAG
jgi:two-component system response regulator MprA